MDILLGDFHNDYIINNYHLSYQQININVMITTWNVNQHGPTQLNYTQIFSNIQQQSPEIIAFGLQQMIALSTNNVLISNSLSQKYSQIWRDQLLKYINQVSQKKYIIIKEQQLVGVFNIVFASQLIQDKISHIEKDFVKTGLYGNCGNKGAVIIKFNVQNTSLAFINCHLQSGQKQLQDRMKNVNQIHEQLFLKNNIAKFEQIDYIFFYGDLNFRIIQPAQTVRNLLNQAQKISQNIFEMQKNKLGVIRFLLGFDQLTLQRCNNPYLNIYKQAQIQFYPTYKYNLNSKQYQTNKNRVPSWCDRILIKNKKENFLSFNYYKRIQCLQTDHRPVVLNATITIKKLLQNNKRETKQLGIINFDKQQDEKIIQKTNIDSIYSYKQQNLLQL